MNFVFSLSKKIHILILNAVKTSSNLAYSRKSQQTMYSELLFTKWADIKAHDSEDR
jgi:hypothetical protein